MVKAVIQVFDQFGTQFRYQLIIQFCPFVTVQFLHVSGFSIGDRHLKMQSHFVMISPSERKNWEGWNRIDGRLSNIGI
jgi:hypothetical protein